MVNKMWKLVAPNRILKMSYDYYFRTQKWESYDVFGVSMEMSNFGVSFLVRKIHQENAYN